VNSKESSATERPGNAIWANYQVIVEGERSEEFHDRWLVTGILLEPAGEAAGFEGPLPQFTVSIGFERNDEVLFPAFHLKAHDIEQQAGKSSANCHRDETFSRPRSATFVEVSQWQ
jgi:hypothetical protein